MTTEIARFRDRLGVVFQDLKLLPHLSVRENIGLATEHRDGAETASAELERLAVKFGIHDVIDRKPARLSGGQAQRAAIVRALIKMPSLLLADEPTSGLDDETSLNVASELLADPGRTALIVTHNLALARACDRIVRMRDGAIEHA